MATKLLYETTGVSKNSSTFHELCDSKGPTLTIAQCTKGYVFGGYNPQSWISPHPATHIRNRFEEGRSAFLFSLVNPEGTAPTKYNVTNPDFASYHDGRWGPVFGGNESGDFDISFWNSRRDSSVCFPTSFEDTTGRGIHTFTEGTIKTNSVGTSYVRFAIDRLEVWSV